MMLVKMASRSSAILHLKWDYYLEHSPRDYKPVGAQIPKKWFQPENMQNAMDMMESWKPLCEKYDCTIANLALGWILAQEIS